MAYQQWTDIVEFMKSFLLLWFTDMLTERKTKECILITDPNFVLFFGSVSLGFPLCSNLGTVGTIIMWLGRTVEREQGLSQGI
jgi:hypothetical protein